MKHIHTATALERAEAWLGRLYPLSPATFAAAESLHRVCDINGTETWAMADVESTVIGVTRHGDFAGEAWLFNLTFRDTRGTLTLRAATERPHGRAFLAHLLCDAFSPLDADKILHWWRTSTDDRPCTVSVTLPATSSELADLFAQLEQATLQSAAADFSEWGAR